MTLARLDSVREERAIQELRRLGASVGDHLSDQAFGLIEGYTVELGEGWQGKLQDLSRLRWLRDAGVVVLQGPQVTDEWLKCVASMTELSALVVKRAHVSHEGLKQLSAMPGLSQLSLMYVPISDEAIETLRQLQGVRKLKIYGGNLTAAGVDTLRQALPNSDIDYRRGLLGRGLSGRDGRMRHLHGPSQQRCGKSRSVDERRDPRIRRAKGHGLQVVDGPHRGQYRRRHGDGQGRP